MIFRLCEYLYTVQHHKKLYSSKGISKRQGVRSNFVISQYTRVHNGESHEAGIRQYLPVQLRSFGVRN